MRPGSAWSPRAHEALVRLGTELPFEQGPGVAALLTGLRVSASTIRRLTEAAGAELVAAEDAERVALARTLPPAPRGAERQVVSVDGAMVPLVGGNWREVRTLAVGTLSAEATGTPTTTQLSYFSRMTEAERFTELVATELHRRGTEHAAVVAALADGALWCQGVFDAHVPDAIRILDHPHGVEHLGTAARACFGAESEATRAWVAAQAQELRTGDPDQVLAALAALSVAPASDPAEAAASRDREHAYLATRRAQISYALFTAAGLPIGSGCVESANKLVVEARLKGAGMHWAPAHVDPMLALRCALKSERWTDAWRQISQPPPVRVRGTLPVLTAPPPNPPPPALPRPCTPPTIVNGRPTLDHPWKQGLRARNAASSH